MAEITAADVKALREKTGAGMMECKNALVQCGGDFAQAEKLLKEKGLAAVGKRSGRAANEGKIFVKIAGDTAVIAELATETDFVARNPEFIALGEAIVEKALEKGYTGVNEELSAMVTDLAAKIRENMTLKRLSVMKAGQNEYLSAYIHGDGAIGVVVKMAADKDGAFENEAVREMAHNLALHISWANPAALDAGKLDPAFVAENEEIIKKQMEGDESLKGKPQQALDGIFKGKVSKFLKSICLMDQGFVKDEKITVAKALEDCGKPLGLKLSVTGFVYFKVGA